MYIKLYYIVFFWKEITRKKKMVDRTSVQMELEERNAAKVLDICTVLFWALGPTCFTCLVRLHPKLYQWHVIQSTNLKWVLIILHAYFEH